MKTHPTCKLIKGKVVSTFEDGRQLTLDPKDALIWAHKILRCAERGLKKSGEWKKQ